MFAVIYRVRIKEGYEEDFKRHWHAVAQYFIEQRGALGSCLHRAADRTWVAYSRWPDKQTRDASWAGENAAQNPLLPDVIKGVIAGLKACSEEEYPELCLEVVDDLLIT